MLAVLALVPRWLLLGALVFMFGFELGHITAYRHIAREVAEARLDREHARNANVPKPAGVAMRAARH